MDIVEWGDESISNSQSHSPRSFEYSTALVCPPRSRGAVVQTQAYLLAPKHSYTLRLALGPSLDQPNILRRRAVL